MDSARIDSDFSMVCPYCGAEHDRVSKLMGTHDAPVPGNTIVVCVSCEEPIWISADGKGQKMTPERWEWIREVDPAIHYAMIRTIIELRKFKVQRN